MDRRTLGENIIYFRKKKNISQKELAEKIGMTPQNLVKIEKDIVTPRVDTINKIISILNVSPNQLFGAEQYENIHIQIPFSRNFKNLCEHTNISKEKLASILEISSQEITDMVNGTLIPSDELLQKICDEFMVTQEELMENNVYLRNQNEVEILERIKTRNALLDNVHKILESNHYEDYKEIDPETGNITQGVITPEDSAKDYIFGFLRELPLDELIEVFRISIDKQISQLSDKIS